MRIALIVLGLALTLPLLADDGSVEDLVKRAMDAYHEGKKGEAADLLQKAASLVQKEGEQGLASFVPPAPEGWTRGEIESHSGTWSTGGQSFQWTQLEAEYKNGEKSLRLTISGAPQLIQAQKAMVEMMQNEQTRHMMNMDPDRKMDVYNRDGWVGITQIEKAGHASRFALTEKLMVQLDMREGDQATLDLFSDAIDWAGLAAAAK